MPNDALHTAAALQVFSKISLEEAQEIVGFFQSIYQTFQNIPSKVHENILKMSDTLAEVERERRAFIFRMVSRFITPHKNNENHHLNFHNVDDNANLIKLFANIPSSNIQLFEGQIVLAMRHLTADALPDLYKGNKSYLIRALCKISPRGLTDFLGGILPLMAKIAKCRYESSVAALIAEKLAEIYTQANYPLRLQYLSTQFSNIHHKQRDKSMGEIFENWLQDPITDELRR